MYFLFSTIIWLMGELYVELKLTKNDGVITDKNTSRALEIGTIFLFLFSGAFYLYPFFPIVDSFLSFMGLLLVVTGVSFRQYSIHSLGQFFSGHIRFKEEHVLIKEGPYRFFRHPSYFGSVLSYTGLGLASFSWVTLFLFPFAIILLYFYRTQKEEKMLFQVFGMDYLDYAKKTWGFLPFIK